MTNFNEWRRNIFIKTYPSLFILERVDVVCVWEVSWRRGQTAAYWPKVLLNIASLLLHSGWAAHPSVTEGPKPPVCRWLSVRHLVPNWLQLQLEVEPTQAVCGTWLYFCLISTSFLWAYASATITEFNHVHKSSWYSDIFDRMQLFHCSSAFLHRCISWLRVRLRVNMLQSSHTYFSKFHMCNFSSRPSQSPSHTHFTNNAQGPQQRNFKKKLLEQQQKYRNKLQGDLLPM